MIYTHSLKVASHNAVQSMKQAVPTVRPGSSVANCSMQNAIYNQEQLAWRESNTRLSSHPRCLHMLWNKYEFGVV